MDTNIPPISNISQRPAFGDLKLKEKRKKRVIEITRKIYNRLEENVVKKFIKKNTSAAKKNQQKIQ